MNRILITGASGFLGGHLCQQAQAHWQVFGVYFKNSTLPQGTRPIQLDLTKEQEIEKTLNEVQPVAIVHAGVIQVDLCEKEPELAYAVNVESSRHIAEWCAENGSRLIYISSDLVFDGTRGMYSESDTANPVMKYGHSKLAGEKAVLKAYSRACVARLPLMYGFPSAGGKCFFVHMLERLRKKEKVNVFNDQYRTPGLADNMAEAVLELAQNNFSGLMHVAGATRCSREDFARTACRIGKFDESLLNPVSMFEVELPAPRPQDVSLNCGLAKGQLKTKLLSLEEGLQRLFKT